MTLVDDDVAEVVLGIVRDQERCRGLLGVHIERLVGRDQDARVLLWIAARHSRRVGAELVLEGGERLVPQLVPIADEERPAKLSGGRDLPEELHGDVGLARAGGQRQERPLLSASQLLEHGTDRRVLVIAARPLSTGIAHEQGPGQGRFQAEAHRLLIPNAKVARCRELGKRPRAACEARHTVALDEEVTVGGVGQRHIETLAGGVGLRLLETMRWWQVLGLGLD